MTKYYNTDYSYGKFPSGNFKPRHSKWKVALKAVAWILGCLVVMAGCALWIVFSYYSPERIKRLIEEKSSQYLHADIRIGNLDYRLFHSYPWLEFEVDSVTIISNSLDNISSDEMSRLPADADFLASLQKLKGKINLHSLIHEDIDMKGIELEKPYINIVMVNDSIANYNIFPRLPKIKKIPQIDISTINIMAPVKLSFFSLSEGIETALDIENFYLTRSEDKTYGIGFEGIASGHFQEYEFSLPIPISFKTEIKPDFPNFRLTLNNLALNMAPISFEAKGEINGDKSGLDINNLDLHIAIADLFALLEYIPENIVAQIRIPEGLSGYLPLHLSASLKSPYHIDKTTIPILSDSLAWTALPALDAELLVADARLSFVPPHGKKIEADDVYIETEGSFRPNNPDSTFLRINQIKMDGEGINFGGEAEIHNLTAESQPISGSVYLGSPLMESLSYLLPASAVKVAGYLKGNLNFTCTVLNLGKEGVKDINFEGDFSSHSLRILSGKMQSGNVKLDKGNNRIVNEPSASVSNLKTDFKAWLPSYPLTDYTGTRLDFNLTADSILAVSNDGEVAIKSISVKLDALDSVSGTPEPSGALDVCIKGIEASNPSTKFNAKNLDIKTRGRLIGSSPSSNYQTVAPTSKGDDALIAEHVSHTPLVLEYEGGGIIQTVMNMINLDSQVSIDKGVFSSNVYLYPVEFSNLNFDTNLNDLNVSASDVKIGRTGFSLTGSLSGLLPFMTSYSATPLKAVADINFSNVDINQLSWGYYGALMKQGLTQDSAFYLPSMTPYTEADSVCVAIPRNIEASINLKSKAAEYMGYQFSPLSTRILVNNGEATLSKLTIGTPYCTAIVDWTYSTKNLGNIFMDLKAEVKDFQFSPFYSIFPQITKKAPELTNFTGDINADINCRFLMFPDMFMDAQSLTAMFDIKGTELQFAREGKIERITHLMLIEGDEPIKIQNLDITGGFHDNLLQVNPFKIRFDDYQLEFAGVNNTAGDMYYHVALEKSPFHLPFGVSLTGKFSKPEVRLGGTHINDYKSELVSKDLTNKINVNIMSWLRHGWLMFVQQAALFEQNSNKENGR